MQMPSAQDRFAGMELSAILATPLRALWLHEEKVAHGPNACCLGHCWQSLLQF